MATIAATAEVHPTAQLDSTVTIDSGAYIGKNVHIGAGSHIGRNSIIWANTRIGCHNKIYPFCSLGGDPQDKKTYDGIAPLIIGDHNTIREYCFFNSGTADQQATRIGSYNWIMAYVHIAHDCIIGSHLTIANLCQLAGHVQADDHAILGGGVLVHQFRQIGSGAIIGGGEVVRMDVPPYASIALGTVHLNTIGLKRQNATPSQIQHLKDAYRTLYQSNLTLQDAITAIAQGQEAPQVAQLLQFLHRPHLQLIRPKATPK